MNKRVKRRRGTNIEHQRMVGGEGELTIDSTKNEIVVHDGVTVGGHRRSDTIAAFPNGLTIGGVAVSLVNGKIVIGAEAVAEDFTSDPSIIPAPATGARYWRLNITQNQLNTSFTVAPRWLFYNEEGDLIPTTTGVAIASSSINAGNGPEGAFDGNTGPQWASGVSDLSPWLGYIFAEPEEVFSIAWTGWYSPGQANNAMLGGQIEHSDDGVTWHPIGDPITNQTSWGITESRTFRVQGDRPLELGLIAAYTTTSTNQAIWSIPQFFGETSYGHWIGDTSQFSQVTNDPSGTWTTVDIATITPIQPPVGINDGGLIYNSSYEALGVSSTFVATWCREGYQIRGNTIAGTGFWACFNANGGWATYTGATLGSQETTSACAVTPDGQAIYFVTATRIVLLDANLNFVADILHGQSVNFLSTKLWVDGSTLWFGTKRAPMKAALDRFYTLPLDLSSKQFMFDLPQIGTQSETGVQSAFSVTNGILSRACMEKSGGKVITYERWQTPQ